MMLLSKTTIEGFQEPADVSCKPEWPVPIKKQIRAMEEADVNRYYCLGDRVCASSHPGMDIMFARRRSDDAEVVVKSIQKSLGFENRSEENSWRQTSEYFLNLPRCDGLCQVLDVVETRKNYYVLMDKCEGQDIFDQLVGEGISAEEVRDIARQLIGALKALHSTGRVHKDLKLENAVVNVSAKTGITAKLIDFDTVVPFGPGSPKSTSVMGTDGYIAPEAYDGNYSPASDMYAAGVMIYTMLTRRSPMSTDLFDDKPGENYVGHPSMKRIRDRLRKERINFKLSPFDRLPEASELVQSMLAFEPTDRPSAAQVLNHKWLKKGDSMASELVQSMLAFEPTDRPSAAQALNHKWFTKGDSIGTLRGALSTMSISNCRRKAVSEVSTADELPSYVADDGDDFSDGDRVDSHEIEVSFCRHVSL